MFYGEKIIRKIIAMSLPEAYKVLGFPPQAEVTEKELDKRFRYLTLQHHPDKGGKPEDMRALLTARDVIDANFKYKLKQTLQEQEADKRREEYKKEKEESRKAVEQKFKEITSFIESNKSKFTNYFKQLVSIDTSMNIKKKSISEENFSIDVEFKSDDGVYFIIDITYYNSDFLKDEMYIDGHIFYNNKTYKMEQKKYNKKSINTLIEPSNIFPEAKLKKIFLTKKDQGEQKFTKADAEATLKRELGATYQGKDFYQIPITDGPPKEYILVYRNVFMGLPHWGINGIYKGFRRVGRYKTIIFAETLEPVSGDKNFKDFVKYLKEAVKGNIEWFPT